MRDGRDCGKGGGGGSGMNNERFAFTNDEGVIMK